MTRIPIKELILAVFPAAVGVAAVISCATTGASAGTGALFLLYVSVFAFSSLFLPFAAPLWVSIAVPAATSLIVLPPSPWNIAGVIGAILLSVWGAWEIRSGAVSLPNFSVRTALRGGLSVALTGMAIIVSLFYYDAYRSNPEQSLIPKRTFDLFWPQIARSLPAFSPGIPAIDPDVTVDEFLTVYVRTLLEGRRVSSAQFESLIDAQRQVFSEEVGAPLAGNERIGDVLYALANRRANQYLGSYVTYAPAALALGVFAALRALFIPVQWLAMLAAYLLLRAGILAGWIRREKTSITATTYRL